MSKAQSDHPDLVTLPEDFDAFYQREFRSVVALAYALSGSRIAAEDLAQEVFLRVYRARRSYRPNSKFSTWLFVIVNPIY